MKRFQKLMVSAICFMLLLVLAIPMSVFAGVVSNEVVNDNFDADELNEFTWTRYGDEEGKINQVLLDSPSARFNKGLADGTMSAVVSTKRLNDITEISFDYKMTGADWFGINFIQQDELPADYKQNPAYDLYNAPILITKNALSANTSTKLDGTPLSGDTTDQWVRMIWKFKSPTEIEVYSDYVQEDETAMDLSTLRATFTSTATGSLNNAYIHFGMNSSVNGGFSLDNITVTYNNGVDSSENFDGALGTEFRIDNNSADRPGITVGGVSNLTFDAPAKGARIISTTPISDNQYLKDTDTVLDFSFDLEYRDNEQGARFGIVFGLDTPEAEVAADATGTAGTTVYTIHAFAGELCIYDEAGQKIVTEGKNRNGFDNLCDDGINQFRIVVQKSGDTKIYFNDQAITVNGGYPAGEGANVAAEFAQISPFGYFGFVSLDDPENVGELNVSVDNVVVINNSYKVPTTKSLSHNFNNDYIGNTDYPDFYITSDPDDSIVIQDGRLNYSGASDNSFFGTTYEYDNFIMEFKITDIFIGTDDMTVADRTTENKWLGINFGRVRYDATNYLDSPMAYFRITPENGEGLPMDANMETLGLPDSANVVQIQAIPHTLFDAIQYTGEGDDTLENIKEEDAVCVRWIAEDNTISLQLKKASDRDYIEYARIENIETTGFVAICNTGFTYLNIDDFSMTNTSTIYEIADTVPPASSEDPGEDPSEDPSDQPSDPTGSDVNLDEELNYLDLLGGNGINTGAAVGIACATCVVGGGVAVLICWLVFKKKQ